MIPSFVSLLLTLGVVSARDWSKLDLLPCSDGNNAVCLVQANCDQNKDQLVHLNTVDQSRVLRCSAVAIIKQFSSRKWLVSLQALDIGEKNKVIAIKIDGKVLIGCRSDDFASVKVESEPNGRTGPITNEMFSTIVHKTGLLCKFTVEGNLAALSAKGISFSLVATQHRPLTRPSNELYGPIDNTAKCDPSVFNFHAKSMGDGETSLRPLYEFDRVRCDTGATLKYVKKEAFEATIACQDGSPPTYKVTKNGGEVLRDLTRLSVACTTKTCTRCGDIELLHEGADNIKLIFKAAEGNECAKLECPNDRIQVPGAPATVAKPRCKEVKQGTGDFRWTIAHPGEQKEYSFTEARCPKTVKCNDVHKLIVECVSAECKDMIDPTAGKIACRGDFRLATRFDSSAWSLIESIECDSLTGVWNKTLVEGRASVNLNAKEKIKCLTEEESKAAEKQEVAPVSTTTENPPEAAVSAGLSTGAAIAIAIVGVIVILIIGGFAFNAVHKRRAKEERILDEVDAKPPTPPSKPDSDKYSAAEVSFSGNRATPSLKTPKPDPVAPKLILKPIPASRQFEDAVSVTAPLCPTSAGSSDKPTPPPLAPPPSAAPPPPKDSADISKKKVAELLDQSVPSMSDKFMPEYKLYYGEMKGLGEVPRQLFALAGVEFEDIRLTMAEWPEVKKKFPFGQAPVLFVDGNPIPQSHAINRYIAKQYGLAGKTSYEAAWVDAIADQWKDFHGEFKKYWAIVVGFLDGNQEAARAEIAIPARDKFFPLIVKQLEDTATGYLVGSSLTWADVLIANTVEEIESKDKTFLADYPEVVKHQQKVHAIPSLKKWIETRPFSKA